MKMTHRENEKNEEGGYQREMEQVEDVGAEKTCRSGKQRRLNGAKEKMTETLYSARDNGGRLERGRG